MIEVAQNTEQIAAATSAASSARAEIEAAQYAVDAEAGLYDMANTGIGDYSGERSIDFTIKKASIKKAKFSKVKAKKLKKQGKAVKPKVKVKYKGKKLKRNRDYKIKYKNNKKRGTAKIIIKGKGNFKGKKVIKFKIK